MQPEILERARNGANGSKGPEAICSSTFGVRNACAARPNTENISLKRRRDQMQRAVGFAAVERERCGFEAEVLGAGGF